MNIRTQRLIDAVVGQALCAVLSLWARCWARPQPPVSEQPLRQVLVIMLSEMGSMVLAGPMFARIRQQHPQAQIHILQLARNQQVARMLQLAPDTHLHGLDDSSMFRLLADIWRVMRQLRQLRLDAVIDCELFSRISALLAYACGARWRAGFTPHTQEGLYRGSFMNAAIPYNPYRHISQQFLALVDAIGATDAPRSKRVPMHPMATDSGLSLVFAPSQLSDYAQALRRDHPALMAAPQRVLMYAGGGLLPIRAWPAAHYAELARTLCDQGHAVAVIGLPEDQPLAQDILRMCDHPLCHSLVGYTRSLQELLMLFHHCDVLVTNDGGPGHFASLTPIRTLMFFGPETSRLYGPLTPRATVIELGLPCSPCLSAYNHRDTPCNGDNQCLKQIDVAQVLRLTQTQLALAASPGP